MDAAIFTLDAAARRLSSDRSRTQELAQAHLYLGIAYLGKGHETLAKARFKDALTHDRGLSLSPEKFAPRVLELFEKAKEELGRSGPAEAAAPPQAEKKSGSKTPLILAGIAVAGGAGIAVAAGGGKSSSASATSPNYRVDAADTQSFPGHGGSGGGGFQMPCPPGSLMVGIVGQSDTFLPRLAARCAVLQPDGSLGAETLLSPVGGPNGVPFEDHCPSGQVVVFVNGSSAFAPIGVTAIQSLGIGCASVREWVASGTRGQVFPTHGGAGGTVFADQCNTGYAVTSFTGGAAFIVERVAVTCARIQR